MSIFKARIFQNSLFKQLKFFAGSSHRVQTCFLVSEIGTLSIEIQPMNTGYAWSDTVKMAWNIIHPLKVQLEGQENPVLPITERSRFPLDPFNHYSSQERDELADVKMVGRDQYKDAYARIADEAKESQNARMVKTVLYITGILVAIIIIVLLVRR